MKAFQNIVIRASAGTGKTFQLSNRFIGLAARGVALDSLLATTFTRKAAGEILDRVLLRLAEAGLDKAKFNELKKHVPAFDLDREGSLELLKTMLSRLHRMRVGTLDSFFNHLAQSFSLELMLPPGWRIVDEITAKRLRAEAVHALLESASIGDASQLMALLNHGESSRSVSDRISELVSAMYSVYLEAPTGAWHRLGREKPLGAAEMNDALMRLQGTPLPEDKRLRKAVEDDCRRFREASWEAFVKTGLANKIVQSDPTYYRKPIGEQVQEAYAPLIGHARAVLVNRLVDQTEATERLLHRFDAAFQRLKLSRQALRFDDVTRKLAAGWVAKRMEEVSFRLDARVAHLLLDEFQDTSPLQWRVLKPFALDVTGNGKRSFFCVGDVKQAIYGWRGGVAEIFDAITEELPSLKGDALNRSYRAGPAVMDVVNLAFKNLEGNAALKNYADAAASWQARFEDHVSAREELPGYARLEEAPLEDPMNHAATRIAEIHKAAPDRSVGVLVRTNKMVARLIYELRTNQGIEASEEGGNPLIDSPAVELVLSVLKMADHPGDRAARFHVARSPLGEALGFTDHEDRAAADRLSREIRNRLLTAGYGPTVHDWTVALMPLLDTRDLDRLLQLEELAYGYEDEATLRTAEFIETVNEKRVESPSSARVRVMTVHQAKGLGFDSVVLPQLDTKLFNDQRPLLAEGRPAPAAPIDRLCRFVSKGGNVRRFLPPSFQRIFVERERQAVEESLCVLYVAMTRAKNALYMIVPPVKGKIPARFDGLLRHGLAENEAPMLFEHGDPKWYEKLAAKRTAPVEQAPPIEIRFAEKSRRPAHGLDRQSPSALESGGLVDLKQRLMSSTSRLLDEGNLVHAWFELIEWLDEGVPDDERLLEVAGPFTGLDVPALMKRFRAALQRPDLRDLLTRPPGDTTAWRERPFALRDGRTLLSGKIDRLVAFEKNGKPVRAEVIDFKTDSVSADNLQARVEAYRPQIEAYARAAARLLDLVPGKVAGRLVFTETGEIVTL